MSSKSWRYKIHHLGPDLQDEDACVYPEGDEDTQEEEGVFLLEPEEDCCEDMKVALEIGTLDIRDCLSKAKPYDLVEVMWKAGYRMQGLYYVNEDYLVTESNPDFHLRNAGAFTNLQVSNVHTDLRWLREISKNNALESTKKPRNRCAVTTSSLWNTDLGDTYLLTVYLDELDLEARTLDINTGYVRVPVRSPSSEGITAVEWSTSVAKNGIPEEFFRSTEVGVVYAIVCTLGRYGRVVRWGQKRAFRGVYRMTPGKEPEWIQL